MPANPLAEHVSQLNLYLHSLAMSDGVILYHDKSNGTEKEFSHLYDEMLAYEDIGFFEILYFYIVKKMIPECTCIHAFKAYHCTLFEKGELP